MRRTKHYPPFCLSSVEQKQFERRAGQYTLPYFQVQRAKMIVLAAEGFTNDEIPPVWTPAAKSSIFDTNGFCRRKPRRPGRTLSSGPSPDFSPLIWWFPIWLFKLRLVLANCGSVSPCAKRG